MANYLNNYIPGLKYGAKILPSEILGADGYIFGNVYYVDPTNGSDANPGSEPTKAFATVDAANDALTTNNNDVVYLNGYANHTLTEMLDVSKSRVHFRGIDFDGRKYGQTTKISLGVTTATTDVYAVKNTGVRNSFIGIKISNHNTVTENVACFGEGGEYTVMRNCEIYDSTELDSDTHAEVVMNGDSAQFFDCTFGSLADAVSGDKVRPAWLLARETITGKVCRDVYVDGCRFLKKAGGTTTAMVKATGATDVERALEFHNCQFIANVLGAQPAVAIACAATLTEGQILLTGDTASFECTKIATATGVFSALPARVATATIGIQTT